MDSKWKKIFYRFLDAGDFEKDVENKLLCVEETIFLSIKLEVLEELGDDEWDGNIKQQRLADLKVAVYLKHCFKDYEKNRPKSSKTFFKF